MVLESLPMHLSERHLKNALGFGVVTGVVVIIPVFLALFYSAVWATNWFTQSYRWENLALCFWAALVGSLCLSVLAGVKVFRFLRRANIS
jgi:ABC-type Fe3+ transport system permease subunit